MFTGIVTHLGTIIAREASRFRIAADLPAEKLPLGGSIACDGCCLTAVNIANGGQGVIFDVDVSNETQEHTTMRGWNEGRRINLELPLGLGAELGGHLVTGHIDGVAKIVGRREDGESIRIVLDSPPELARFIASKGSVALDGVSLTVNEVDGTRFGVNLIPFTLAHTTWGERDEGDSVNLEVDLIARYVERLTAAKESRPS